MNCSIWRHVFELCFLGLIVFSLNAFGESAPPADFVSYRQQLPNPDRPYETTSDAVQFGPIFTLFDLQFSPHDPTQLEIPSTTPSHTWAFDSTFDIDYKAQVSFGEPPWRKYQESAKRTWPEQRLLPACSGRKFLNRNCWG